MAWVERRGNKFLVRWDIGTGDTRKKSALSFDSKEAAEQFKKKLEYEASIGISFDPSSMTFNEYLEHWLNFHKDNLKPKTIASYRSNIKCHIAPHLGQIKLIKLTPLHLQSCYSLLLKEGKVDLLTRQRDHSDPKIIKNAETRLKKLQTSDKKGLSSTSVVYIHRIIHKALNQAVKWQMVARNVADAVEVPKPEDPNIQYLNRDQVNKFISLIKESPDYPLIAAAVMTGMRQGEILGLRWQDVDFEHGVLHIRQQLQYLPESGFFFKEPKQNSKRDVPIQLPLQAILRKVKKEQDEIKSIYAESEAEYNDLDLVFCGADGSPLDGCGVTKRFQRLLVKNEFPKIRFHSLRHTFATMCRGAEINMEDIQDLLGHADISTTKKMYTHVEIEPLKRAMDKLSQYLESDP